MENLKLKHNDEIIDTTRLYTMSEYSRTFGVPISTVKYQTLAGILKMVAVNGTKLVLREEEK